MKAGWNNAYNGHAQQKLVTPYMLNVSDKFIRMKKSRALSIILLLSFITFNLIAQKKKSVTPELPFDDISEKITYTEVVTIDSTTSSEELFSRGREWFAKAYNSSNNVIQMEDKESGKLVGKALMQVYHKAMGSNYPSGHINYTISLYFKLGRYKYVISDFHHTGQLVGGGNRIPDYGVCEEMINTTHKTMGMSYQKTYNNYLSQMDNNIKSLISDLKNSMLTKASGVTSDDW